MAGKFLPARALKLLVSAGSARGVGKRYGLVAVMFVDIEGCTRLCEDLPPREMNGVIESYFSEFLTVIRKSGGEVTEVLGDGLLALFEGRGLKGSIKSTFEAALQIQARTRVLNHRRHRQHDPIAVNIGLNAARALVGFTRLRDGASERWVYTATGPVTNVAARLCALATRGQILATKATADLLPDGCECRSLGPHQLKNVTGPVEVVEILPGGASMDVVSKGRSERHSTRRRSP